MSQDPQVSVTDCGSSYSADIVNMLAYCRSDGIALEGLEEEVDRFCASAEGRAEVRLAADVRLHGLLARRIRPATPRTLAATAYLRRPFRLGPALVLLLILGLAAFAGISGYVATLPGAIATTSVWRVQTSFLCAAVLGAAFSGLLVAYPYVRDRTFDPRYLLAYAVRLVLGIIAGMVLGNLWGGTIQGDSVIAQLGPGMIALLGGYSAEAVRQILDRLVEVLVTLVRGSPPKTSQAPTEPPAP